jgi:hypothetical protein
MNIGFGFHNLKKRATVPLWVAIALVTLAFALDTATTVSAGGLRGADLNPLVRNLSPAGYLASSLLRLVASLLILVWFWPEHLRHRQPPIRLAALYPFSFRQVPTYFGAVLVIAGALVKLAAAASNWALIRGSSPDIHPLGAVLVGLALGVVASASLLHWHSRSFPAAAASRLNCREHG